MRTAEERVVASRQMWVTIAFVLAGTFVAQVVILGLLYLTGYDLKAVSQGVLVDLPQGVLMAVLGSSQLFSYLIPGFVAAYLLYRTQWAAGLGLARFPTLPKLVIGLVLFASTLYLTAALASVNAQIELADWQTDVEGDVAALLDKILGGDSMTGLLAALFVVAVLPAVGEEVVFRGLLQPALISTSRSMHVGIWLTALLFGLIHGQFAGLLPRIFLGAVLGFLAHHSRSLWMPILAHFLFNGLQVLAVKFGGLNVEAPSASAATQVETWELGLAFLLAGLGFYFLLPRIQPTSTTSATIEEEGAEDQHQE